MKMKTKLEDWQIHAIETAFRKDAMQYDRDKFVSRTIRFDSEKEVADYVDEEFRQKVEWAKESIGVQDFDGSEQEGMKEEWIADIIRMCNEPCLLPASKYIRVQISHPLFGWVETKASWDGNRYLTIGCNRFDVKDQIESDLADFEKMNEGLSKDDRHYIAREGIYFGGAIIEGEVIRLSYNVLNDSRSASGATKFYHKKYGERDTYEINFYSRFETRVHW